MKKFIFLLCFLVLITPLILVCAGPDIFGYFETQGSLLKTRSNTYNLFTNKLRLDINSKISNNIHFVANVNFVNYNGKKEYKLLDFIPDKIRLTIPEDNYASYTYTFKNRIYLDNAFMRLSMKYFDITLGKQQISLGTGYIWNPVDIFNIKNIMDPTYEQPGHNSLRVDIPFKNAFEINCIYFPDKDWNHSKALIKFKWRIGHFDFSLMAAQDSRFMIDYYSFDSINNQRTVLGGDFSGQILVFGVWGEFAYSKPKSGENYYELLVGLDYTFDSQLYIMSEFYRNTNLKTNKDNYTLNDWLHFFDASTRAIARDQLFFMAQYPITDLIQISGSFFYCFSDKSIAFIPQIHYPITENFELFIAVSIYFGKEDTAYSSNLGNGGFVRLRVYF